jgi:hypothetical protein
LSAGERIEIALRLPETRLDPTALTIPRGDVQLELDDTQVTATVELNLFVSPGPPVAGTADEPLLRVTLPTGAELRGVAPDAESMSLSPRADGGFDVLGPIGPGAHSLGFSYRRASGPEGVELDMRFPHEVETLNVLIADTEVALDSDRLHRRRPFRNGTRNYLHREAYNVGPDEVVHLSLVPIRAAGIPPMASKAIAGAAAAGGVFFLMAPLLRAGRREQAADPEIIRIQDEREGVYIAIDDLEHDFETGKLEEADYNAMRDDLRTQAIDLLRIERAGGRTGEPATYAGAAAPSGAAAPDAIAPTGPGMPATGRFCPSCGGQVDPVWKFCSHCGGSLNPGPSAAS